MKYIILITSLIIACNISAQNLDSTDYARLPDKVFLHLDRNLYSPGDTIWAKAYVFHRNNQHLSNTSYALHIQMLAHDGKEMGTYKMLIIDGMGYGQIPVYKTMKPGFYQIIAHTSYMKNFGPQFVFNSTIEIREHNAKLSIKTFFDKADYAVGDTAKVSFRLFDEFHMLLPKKRFRYELRHQEETLSRSGLRTYDDGTVSIMLPITAGSKKQPPYLQLTYEEDEIGDKPQQQKVYVPVRDNKISIQFFPESGDLVRGLPTKIAYEAVDALGEVVPIEGVLLEDGKIISQVKSLFDGRGFFALLPQTANYTFKITRPQGIDSVFALPDLLHEGYNFAYLRQDSAKVSLRISHNYSTIKSLKLWVSQYDHLNDVFNLEVQQSKTFSVPKHLLPQGLVTLTLTTKDDQPVAERLVYIPLKEKTIHISTDKLMYSQRKKVNVFVSIEGLTSTAHLSAAVIDSVLGNSPYLDVQNIQSYGLLASELKGNVKYLNTYLQADKTTMSRCDLLMLTHGWRRFIWIHNQQQLDSLKVYDFNPIDGLVKRHRKPHPKAQMTAMVLGNNFTFAEFTANANGRFRIRPQYEDRNSQKLLIIGRSSSGKENVTVSLFNTDTLNFGSLRHANRHHLDALVHDYNNFVSDEKKESLPFLSYESKLLKELVVYGERSNMEDENAYSEAMAGFAAGTISGEDLIGGYSFGSFVEQASHRAQYLRLEDRILVRDRGGFTVTSMTDSGDSDTGGDMMNSETDYNVGADIYVNDVLWGKEVSALDFLTKEEILEIVVLDPQGAFSYYGSDGKYGVVLVRTTENYLGNGDKSINRNMAVFGRFIDSKEYYKPVYKTKQQDSLIVVDNRVTLHWEPFVETDADGKASFEFYTDDISGTKQIVIQGIDDQGHLFYQTKDFSVRTVGYPAN